MAQWQIFKGKTTSGAPIQVGEQFDDGRIEQPGAEGFTTDLVAKECAKRKGDSWSYIGRSTVYTPAMEDEVVARAAPIIDAITADLEQRSDAESVAALADDIASRARAAVIADLGLREG